MVSRESAMNQRVVDIIVKRREESMRRSFLHERLLAEFAGSLFLALAVGVSITGGGSGSTAPVAIGLVLAIQVYAFGPVSGGFFNPAVVLAVLMAGRGKISFPHAVLYAVAEFLGAIAGGFCAFAATGRTFCFDYALTRSWGTSLEFEVLFTVVLCMSVLSTGTSNDAPNQYFGFAIGMTVTGCALAVGDLHQCCLNPAVALGMNLANYANGAAAHHPSEGAWALFLLAPLLGGVLAAIVFCSTRGNEYESLAELEAPTQPAPTVGATYSSGWSGWSLMTMVSTTVRRPSTISTVGI